MIGVLTRFQCGASPSSPQPSLREKSKFADWDNFFNPALGEVLIGRVRTFNSNER
jgi:hypothetical protein